MKKNTIISAICLLYLAGCTTVKVSKVSNTDYEKGLRYTLGKPFIKVTPNASGDGTYLAELIYLPDDNQIYAVHVSSFMTKYTMELNVDENGILKKVDWSRNETTPVGEGVAAAADIIKAELDRQKKLKDEEDKKLKDEIKANKDALAAARTQLEAKVVELQNAKNDLASLNALYPVGSAARNEGIKEKVRVLEVQIAKLELEKANLEKKITDLESTRDDLAGAANEATGTMAYGPVLFAIEEKVNGGTLSVSLKAVPFPDGSKQKSFETGVAAANGSAEQAPKLVNSKVSATYNASNVATVTIVFNAAVESVDKAQSRFVVGGTNVSLNQFSPVVNGKEVTIPVARNLVAAGVHRLFLTFHYKDKAGVLQEDQALIEVTLQ